MAICGHCGAEGPRIRSVWRGDVHLRDECPSCAPQAFEKFTAPSDKKIWMGYEAHPNEYVQGPDGGFDRKPEYRAEQEDKLRQGSAEDIEAERVAVERKRATRRIRPMSADEQLAAINKARRIAEAIEA